MSPCNPNFKDASLSVKVVHKFQQEDFFAEDLSLVTNLNLPGHLPMTQWKLSRFLEPVLSTISQFYDIGWDRPKYFRAELLGLWC